MHWMQQHHSWARILLCFGELAKNKSHLNDWVVCERCGNSGMQSAVHRCIGAAAEADAVIYETVNRAVMNIWMKCFEWLRQISRHCSHARCHRGNDSGQGSQADRLVICRIALIAIAAEPIHDYLERVAVLSFKFLISLIRNWGEEKCSHKHEINK